MDHSDNDNNFTAPSEMLQYSAMNKDTKFIIADHVTIGKRITFGPNCNSVSIGFGSFLGDDLYIDVPELAIGEYTTIHRGGTIHGYKACHIGHNCWVGQFVIIDSIGGATIQNNVGIGAHSQLWSHLKFGDVLSGCRWNSSGPLLVEDDVWFVGHCIVSPIHARKRSMLMVGGVITTPMEENHIYGGTPAIDLTSELGTQFEEIDLATREDSFQQLCLEFRKYSGVTEAEFTIETTTELHSVQSSNSKTYFDLKARAYSPSRSENEFRFMKFLLYDKAKFVPHKSLPLPSIESDSLS